MPDKKMWIVQNHIHLSLVSIAMLYYKTSHSIMHIHVTILVPGCTCNQYSYLKSITTYPLLVVYMSLSSAFDMPWSMLDSSTLTDSCGAVASNTSSYTTNLDHIKLY